MIINNDYIFDDSFLIEDSEDEQAPSDNIAEDLESEETAEAKSDEVLTEENQVEESAEIKSEEVSAEEKQVEEDSDKAKSNESSEISFPYLIGKKVGMTQLFSDDGESFPVTVVEAGPCSIIQIKSDKYDGYNAVQLGYEDLKKNKINNAVKGHFSNSDIKPKKHLKEFMTLNNEGYNLGDTITVNQFTTGDFITVTGTSKGKGFTGHMKRHGFGGGRRSHGKNSVMRKSGSVGAGSDPSRVFPGMKMAGRKGNYNVTIKNLQVVKVDQNKNLMFVSGSIPGAKNSVVYLSKI